MDTNVPSRGRAAALDSCEFVFIRGFLSAKHRHEIRPPSDFFPVRKGESMGVKTMSVLLTCVLLVVANQLATRLKNTGRLPANHHHSLSTVSPTRH
jgi:hypothetical protein